MKRKFFLIALAVVGVVGVLALPSIARYQRETRRRTALEIVPDAQTQRRLAAMDIPQSQRMLRVPTSQKIDALLPKGARQILEQSPRWTLFSVEPRENYEPNKKTFHRHEILGQTIVADARKKRELLASLYDSFVPAKGNNIKFGCFNPRHGIRATLNGKTVDLLICFHCRQFNGYLNDHQFATYEFITSAPAPTFNATLTAAGVPLSQK